MTFSEMFSDSMITSIIIKALIVGFLVSLCSSLLGVSLVLKRYSMIGDGLSHVGFFAMAVSSVAAFGAFSLEFEILLVVVSAIVLLRLNNSKTKGDAAIAIFSTAGVALGSIVYNVTGNNTTDVCTSLFGSTNIFTIDNKDMALSVILCALVLAFFIFFYTKIFAVTFDGDFAKATGTKVNTYNTLIAILTAVTIVLGMKMMGAIMISGLIIFPALTAMRVCKTFRSVVIFSSVIAIICYVVGFFVACRYSFQTGPTVVTINVGVFVIFCIISTLLSKNKKEIVK